MTHAKLKALLCVTIGLTVLLAPLFLDVAQDGKAYAMGYLGKKSGNGGSSGRRVAIAKPKSPPESNPISDPNGQNPPAPVPEPASLLLFGAGAVGFVALKKKLKKK